MAPKAMEPTQEHHHSAARHRPPTPMTYPPFAASEFPGKAAGASQRRLGNAAGSATIHRRRNDSDAYPPWRCRCWAALPRLCVLLPLPARLRPTRTSPTCRRLSVRVGSGVRAASECATARSICDGSCWHQWMGGNGWVGPTWNYDCVGDSGNNTFPAPPPPGGCNGAIPPEPRRNLTVPLYPGRPRRYWQLPAGAGTGAVGCGTRAPKGPGGGGGLTHCTTTSAAVPGAPRFMARQYEPSS